MAAQQLQQLQQQQYYYQQQYPQQQQQQGFGMPGEPMRYFELEQAVQELRPLVIQVLNTQMYHNSTAAVNLRRGIRQVREICKQLRSETVLLSKQKKTPDAAAGVPAVVAPTAAPTTNPPIPDAAPITNAPFAAFAHAPIPGVAPYTSAPIPGGAPASSAPPATESTLEQPAKRPKIETNPATAPSPPCDQPPRAFHFSDNLPKTSIVGGSPLGRNFIIVPDEDREIPAAAAT